MFFFSKASRPLEPQLAAISARRNMREPPPSVLPMNLGSILAAAITTKKVGNISVAQRSLKRQDFRKNIQKFSQYSYNT